jgi:uncharacterized C2H2 Zn-finger protein
VPPATTAHYYENRTHSNDTFQVLSYGTTQKGSIPNATTSTQRNAGKRERPRCPVCEKDFGRTQDVERHIRDIHTPKKKCPLCDMEWTRPESIKAHLINQHSGDFTTDTRNEINALRGRDVVQFLELFTLCRDMQVTSALPAPSGYSLP